MKPVRRAAGLLLELLAPSACLACHRTGARSLALCTVCRGSLKPLRGPSCAGCARPLAGPSVPDGYLCGGCRRRRRPIERLVAVWSYEPPFDRVIHGLKYQRLEFLGGQLAREIVAHRSRLPRADLVVPVPLHWLRHAVRGYNQAEAIARPLARLLGLPLARALVRRRPTTPQARLALDRGQRAANLLGAFRCRGSARVRARRVLLVDDVVTTGATLAAAARTLRGAGARRVTALAAGRTPGPGER